jgi:hypothetical protein
MANLTYVSIAIFFVLVLLGFLFLTGNKKAKMINSAERFQTQQLPENPAYAQPVRAESVASIANASAVPDSAASGIAQYQASEPSGNEVYTPIAAPSAGAIPPQQGSCFPRDRLSAEDLLPKDAANSRWAQMNPAGQGDVQDQNFLTAGYHVGVNTVGQSLRNANLQLRSEPPNPQVPVSPWNISTIEPDTNRVPLEIGSRS